MMKQLTFVAPRYDSFVNCLHKLLEEKVRPILLVGNNDLARKLELIAKEKGINLNCINHLNDNNSNDAEKIIVFTETSGELLGSQLLVCIGLGDVTVVAPTTDWHFSRKPLFLVSIPKAGTHLLYGLVQALGYYPGVELPECPQDQTWYCLESGNSHTVAHDFFVDTVRRKPFGNRHHPFIHSPTLFIFRHPLDILVSEGYYYHLSGKTTFGGWLSQYDFSERVEQLLGNNSPIGSLRERINGFLPWLDLPNVIPFSFEELIGADGGGKEEDQQRLIWSIQLKLQVPGSPKEIASRIFNSNSPTFRSGQIGGYKNHLSPESISAFATQNSDILEQLGYPVDGSPGLTAKMDRRLHKPIVYSKIDHDKTSTIVESGFLDCNFVRYNKRIFALPIATGPISLEELSPDILAVIPVADSVENLKILLTIGASELAIRTKALQQLATLLREEKSSDGFNQYWNKEETHSILEVYKGYNIVAYADRYLALRQSAGEVNLIDNSLDKLVRLYGIDDLLITVTVDDLRNEIDKFTSSQRLKEKTATAEKKFLIEINALKSELATLTKRLVEQEQQLFILQENSTAKTAEELGQSKRNRKE